jgi:hypothetical protein
MEGEMKIFGRALACALLVTSASALAGKTPEISGLELQQMQSRDFEAPKSITFPAVMTVLQDAGYRIGSADRDTGLITGTGSSSRKLTWNLFFGLGTSKKNPVVSAYIEDRGPGMSRVRLNFVMARLQSNGYGSNGGDEAPITDPAAYRDAFEKISQAIFVRQALDAPTPSPTSSGAPTASNPAAAGPATSTTAIAVPISSSTGKQ